MLSKISGWSVLPFNCFAQYLLQHSEVYRKKSYFKLKRAWDGTFTGYQPCITGRLTAERWWCVQGKKGEKTIWLCKGQSKSYGVPWLQQELRHQYRAELLEFSAWLWSVWKYWEKELGKNNGEAMKYDQSLVMMKYNDS